MDYLIAKMKDLDGYKTFKVVLGECLETHHKILVLDVHLNNEDKRLENKIDLKLSGGT